MAELDPKLEPEVGLLEEETPLFVRVHQIPFVVGTNATQDGRAPLRWQCDELFLLLDLVKVPPALPYGDNEMKKNERMLSGLA